MDADAMTAGTGGAQVDSGDDDDGGAEVCDVRAPTACPSSMPTYADVEPILQERCMSCHSGETRDGPWPFKTYEHAASWSIEIRSAMLMCAMPPPSSGIEMPTEERLTLLEWIRCGSRR